MWTKCVPHGDITLNYRQGDSGQNLHQANSSEGFLEGGTYLRVVRSLEERLVKLGNIQDMKPRTRRRKRASQDSFVEAEDSDDMFKLKLVFPEREDYFVFRGTLTDFIGSDLYAQMRSEKEGWAQQKEKEDHPRAQRKLNTQKIRLVTEELKPICPQVACEEESSKPSKPKVAQSQATSSKGAASSSSQTATFAFETSRQRRSAARKQRHAATAHS